MLISSLYYQEQNEGAHYYHFYSTLYLGPSQCSKIRKRRRKNKTEKEETKLSFPDDMIITDKLLELTRDSNKFTRHKISL